MISKKMDEALNKQLNAELFSSYLYLSMSAHFESIGFKGFANWMKLQSHEEYEHAMKFFNYILEVQGEVTLEKIETPKKKWESHLQVFEETLKHERFITASIKNLAVIAKSEDDFATSNFLQWFINEQIEEENNAQEILDKLKFVGDGKQGILFLDKELGSRK
ncbi:MAG: ferritin [Ignavibacteriales bacterium]|nr:ferritin [Ignavibacteriales bacterium]